MTNLELIQELRGTVCRCGKRKPTKMTFCSTCYHSLPAPKRAALYSRIGEGYAEAYAAAVASPKPLTPLC